MEEKKKKILLIRLSSLGDVIFNLPLACALKDAGYDLTWLVSEKGKVIVENNPCVDKVIFVPLYKWRKKIFSFENCKEFFSLLKQVRAEKFDIAIDCQMMFKSMFWLLLSGAKRRITSKNARELALLAGNEWVNDIFYNPKDAIIFNYLKFAKHLGITPENLRVTLPPRTQKEIEKVENLLKPLDKTKPLVILAPATTWQNKYWDKDNWKSVVNNISEDCNIVFSGTESEREYIESINNGRFLNLAGKTNILELIELFSRAALVITPDSGSAHLAWATGKPAVITIFTCTPKSVFAPYGDENKYVSLGGEGLPCQPCFKKKCKLKKNINACTRFPNPGKVIEVVRCLIF